ncbi:gp53-like domain-containing protein [Paraburkholderia tropica]|uniref:gp53-like domain-containing protein n=1 Tax=Paraburkholderia tropica TaxID=92647 RepID=UPI0016142565|nr:hypothetical protein [Paraburkholderia tropica]MBB3001433.1 hypothetical protein [Paraburkholderia tropica]MDE1140927.1 hypothetical protein [Paraburkholderia tropica]MDE1141127.1 hypothetical protein [Paraburkholderia tropica]
MSLASNLAALARLLTAAASGIVSGKAPAAGDSSTALINSAWFKAEQAAEATQGTAKVATQTQTTAGTDDATIVTPKKLRAGFSVLLGTNGYIALPTWLGGVILQWGTGATTTGFGTLFFPLAFPSGCKSAVANNWGGGTQYIGIQSFTATSLVVNSGSVSQNFTWFAIGF